MVAAERDALALLQRLGIEQITTIEAVMGGWDTSIWRVEAGGRAYALRVHGPNRMESCQGELLAMRAAAIGGIPVPAVFAHHAAPERSAMLLSWVPGQTVLAAAEQHPETCRKLGVILGAMQARIHRVEAPEELRSIGRSWIDWVGPGEEELQERLRALNLRSDVLLHLDYHVRNVMTDGSKVTGVLDWTNSGLGDPRADLARTAGTITVGPRPPGFPEKTIAPMRRALLAGWHQGYREIAGRLRDMTLFYAWAGVVMARDLEPKLGQPGVWLQQSDLDRIRAWTAMWKRRAGLSDASSVHSLTETRKTISNVQIFPHRANSPGQSIC